jgi:anti-anti-sigma regulatory factor
VRIDRGESSSVLKISGNLGITDAEELRLALADFLCATPAPAVDLSEVEECDTTVLQILWASHRTAKRSAKSLQIVGVPDAVKELSAALGLSLPATQDVHDAT